MSADWRESAHTCDDRHGFTLQVYGLRDGAWAWLAWENHYPASRTFEGFKNANDAKSAAVAWADSVSKARREAISPIMQDGR